MTGKPAHVAGVKWRARPKLLLRLLFLASGLLLANCGNCASPSPPPGGVRVPERPTYDPRDPIFWRVEGVDPMVLEYLPFDSEKFLLAGTIDFYNQYTSAVMLTTEDQRNFATCSAVLLGPRIALTAAHCVCERKKSSDPEGPSMTRIDAMSCAKHAYVTTVIYEEAYPDHLLADTASGYYTGDVHPHPDFQLLLDKKGDVISGQADLAIIALQTPVKSPIAYIPLGQTEIQADELLTMSGFGSDKRIGQMDRFRYFRMNKVTRPPEEGRAPYEQRGGYLYNGFDGGPCFREHVDGRRLVGVASMGTQKELAFTSTVFYRQWIESQSALLLKSAKSTPKAPGAPR